MAKDKKDKIGHEIELISHGQESKIIGSCWWNYDKEKVEASDDFTMVFLKMTKMWANLEGEDVYLGIDDGIPFLDELPNYYRSRIAARKKR